MVYAALIIKVLVIALLVLATVAAAYWVYAHVQEYLRARRATASALATLLEIRRDAEIAAQEHDDEIDDPLDGLAAARRRLLAHVERHKKHSGDSGHGGRRNN